MGTNRRQSAQPTHDWQLLLPLFGWPEQERYEQIRPLVLFDVSVLDVEVRRRRELQGQLLHERTNADVNEGVRKYNRNERSSGCRRA